MSMLIIGVNPPKSCYACSWYNKVECPVNDGRYYYRVQRHPSCPLVEIPTPHGRLGDLDELWDRMYKYSDNEGAKMPFGDNDFMIHKDSACELIEDMPTIIEAEGSET